MEHKDTKTQRITQSFHSAKGFALNPLCVSASLRTPKRRLYVFQSLCLRVFVFSLNII